MDAHSVEFRDAGGRELEAEIRVTGGAPTPEEVAAITAVLRRVLEEHAREHRRERAGGANAWARGRRGLRAPLVRGAWRTFGR